MMIFRTQVFRGSKAGYLSALILSIHIAEKPARKSGWALTFIYSSDMESMSEHTDKIWQSFQSSPESTCKQTCARHHHNIE
jgi:hypothetical protein